MSDLKLSSAPAVETGMVIRCPVEKVFEALADPAVTTRFWFTKSTGPLAKGAEVTWTWEMYDVSTPVKVKEFKENERIVFEWGEPPAATKVELGFHARDDGTSYLSVKETGFTGEDGDAVAAWAIGSMGGFTQMIAGLKAYLEHKIVLTIVADRFPDGHPG
jgi:uncharacterized protein YndB with AHSA1/START domain